MYTFSLTTFLAVCTISWANSMDDQRKGHALQNVGEYAFKKHDIFKQKQTAKDEKFAKEQAKQPGILSQAKFESRFNEARDKKYLNAMNGAKKLGQNVMLAVGTSANVIQQRPSLKDDGVGHAHRTYLRNKVDPNDPWNIIKR